MRTLDLDSLEIFRTVAQEGGIIRAAGKLGRVQSNVTTRIKQLEQRLGRSLFRRQGRSIVLSPEGELLLSYTQRLFRLAAQACGYGEFTRAKHGSGTDPANRFLDHGNYLAYGLGATAAWVLGLPHGLAVLHGKTRRGGLVFDIADLIKDAVILPQAFVSAMRGDTEQDFRQSCIESLTRTESLDFMIDTLKAVADTLGEGSR